MKCFRRKRLARGIQKSAVFLSLCFIGGCHHGSISTNNSDVYLVKPVTFDSLQIVSNAGTRGINAAGLKEYIARYELEGWLAGLADDRVAVVAVRGIDVDAVRASGILEDSTELRVKDVFCWYYRKLNKLPLAPAVAAERSVRDKAAQEVMHGIGR